MSEAPGKKKGKKNAGEGSGVAAAMPDVPRGLPPSVHLKHTRIIAGAEQNFNVCIHVGLCCIGISLNGAAAAASSASW